ncbi:BgTH12-02711 [Blumeria graminis f. sp. triticale]|uniref:Mediator of RNA polymerase II transcription subunit 9 n=3 Tax=Blumeria graminis TaxID=34373 RepID=A0A9X9MIA3_BLUGR|nr:hypothetical protein BGT96224_A21416 [Blumeria graminis f. sp. tritici 96224]CAD6503040.1 BgTH12-02711 [Blumeria graminis f. sp. triticale]VDB88976.1 BgtA-21416 [Blumeria graminis f. sp. tritici]
MHPPMKLPDDLTPHHMDTIPILSSLLSRLSNPSSTNQSGLAAPSYTSSPSQLCNSTGQLSAKDIPPATDELKQQLQKAHLQIKQLPDIDRTISEQEEEIVELEEKISQQREVIKKLRVLGKATSETKEMLEQIEDVVH